MGIRENLKATYVVEALKMEKLRTKLKRLTRRMTDEEFQEAHVEVLEQHLAWLKAGRPGDDVGCAYPRCPEEELYVGPVCRVHYVDFHGSGFDGDITQWIDTKKETT